MIVPAAIVNGAATGPVLLRQIRLPVSRWRAYTRPSGLELAA